MSTQSTALQLPPPNAYVAAQKDSPAASPVNTAVAPGTTTAPTDPSAAGLAGVGNSLTSGLEGLGVSSGLASTLPYLAAGGAGIALASGSNAQTQQNVNTLSSLGAPLSAESNSLLAAANSGTLNPAQSNVVATLNSQGQQLISSASPLASIANTAFANYQAGQLQPGQQSQIDAWVASATQQLQQTLASSGITDSSVLASQTAAIQSQATQLKANLMAQNLQVGDQQYAQWLTATQAGMQLQAQGAQYAATSIDTMLSQALQFGQAGMQPIEQAVQTSINGDAATSANLQNLLKSIAGAYSLANAPSAAQQAAALAGRAAGAAGGGGGGGGSSGPVVGTNNTGPNDLTTITNNSAYDTDIGASNDQLAQEYGFDSATLSGQNSSLGVPSATDLYSGNNSVATFGSGGYNLTPDTTVDTNTFNDSFFDPSSVDLSDIDFG